jgi:hypothetical protein
MTGIEGNCDLNDWKDLRGRGVLRYGIDPGRFGGLGGISLPLY